VNRAPKNQHSKPLKPAPEPMENLAPSLLGQEDRNDQYQEAAEENCAGRNSLPAKEPIHTDSNGSHFGGR
jgi:hypothetical protein